MAVVILASSNISGQSAKARFVVVNSEVYSATVFSVTLSGSSILCAAVSRAVITEAPHKRESRRGRIPREHLAL
jgi:hypothetical protein